MAMQDAQDKLNKEVAALQSQTHEEREKARAESARAEEAKEAVRASEELLKVAQQHSAVLEAVNVRMTRQAQLDAEEQVRLVAELERLSTQVQTVEGIDLHLIEHMLQDMSKLETIIQEAHVYKTSTALEMLSMQRESEQRLREKEVEEGKHALQVSGLVVQVTTLQTQLRELKERHEQVALEAALEQARLLQAEQDQQAQSATDETSFSGSCLSPPAYLRQTFLFPSEVQAQEFKGFKECMEACELSTWKVYEQLDRARIWFELNCAQQTWHRQVILVDDESSPMSDVFHV